MQKAKIVVVGPSESGKTYISNFLADATESSGGEYRPTKGARILEFETEGDSSFSGRTEVELWDCSGDKKYENCWPAIWQDVLGVVMVYNPAVPQHEKELDHWFNFFVTQQGLSPDRSMVVGNSRINQEISMQVQKPARLSQEARWIHLDAQEGMESLRMEFTAFVNDIIKMIVNKQKSEEEGIMMERT